jgi:RNA polymerase subunit RPABC4/transcription elongation factor Spt4
MPRWPVQHDAHDRGDGSPDDPSDWDLSEGLDPEGPSAADLDRFGDELSVCPSCKKALYDQSPLCPHCGHLMEEPSRTLSLWVVLVVVLMTALLLLVIF